MRFISHFPRRRRGPRAPLAGLALSATLALAACGGHSGPQDAQPVTPALELSGTAASGAAIAAAPVQARCATGTASTTTAADGSYSLAVAGGSLPCIVRVSPVNGAVLHSLAAGSGGALVVDITPVTELVVAQLAVLDPAAFYDAFDPTVVTTTAVASAQAAVVDLLRAAGLDLGGLGDLISRVLAAGDAYDAALDDLAGELAHSGTTLQALTASVVASAAPAGEAASLPAALLLQPAAAGCGALRSATYRIVSPRPDLALDGQAGLATIDAAALTIVRPDGSTGTLVANGACRFTDTDAATGYSADLVVTPAGVLMARYTAGGTARNFIGFPEQAHALADIAGAWNIVAMNRAGSADVGVTGSATLDAAGQWSDVTNCENDATWAVDVCAAVPASVTGLLGPWTVDAAGGFDVPDAGTQVVQTRVFAYRAGGGSVMLVSVSATGFSIWSPVHHVGLPAAGASTTAWNLDIGPDLASTAAIYETTNVVDSVDAAAGTWTRTHGTVGSAITRVETIFADTPRVGYFHRPASTVTATDGTTPVVVREFTLLRVTGMGLAAGLLPELRTFELSPTEP